MGESPSGCVVPGVLFVNGFEERHVLERRLIKEQTAAASNQASFKPLMQRRSRRVLCSSGASWSRRGRDRWARTKTGGHGGVTVVTGGTLRPSPSAVCWSIIHNGAVRSRGLSQGFRSDEAVRVRSRKALERLGSPRQALRPACPEMTQRGGNSP